MSDQTPKGTILVVDDDEVLRNRLEAREKSPSQPSGFRSQDAGAFWTRSAPGNP